MKNNKYKQIEKFNELVWQDEEMDILRKTRCLCLNCQLVKECDVAQELYHVCVSKNLALMVTRCPDFMEK